MIPTNIAYMYEDYASGFLGLINIHNIYMHCPNLGHFNSISVRGENSIIKKTSKQFVWLFNPWFCSKPSW